MRVRLCDFSLREVSLKKEVFCDVVFILNEIRKPRLNYVLRQVLTSLPDLQTSRDLQMAKVNKGMLKDSVSLAARSVPNEDALFIYIIL